ncbi:AMP-binding protein [Moraxella catarrhalis]|uniref:AMP-binding protein n=1 Tax=Moraxella catarrhalis TaxID=480 RepID=UPI000EA9AB00|nr:AMP-binding protein [Moraxella catarrhalis]MPW96371.1 long-chain fatty acid--CoA ligase [Moraxella catarrhalis]MPX22087.1 long-chain fatty acid--CoA ligase [Moraxella catarrhalis]RKM24644.1 long-chain fatty acid--CoA ligase [Moraxella catarrhalis]RKM27046.1 long-chain fatty acid--CoA ligase [Moraxella catarrhalis]RKM27723.1 long-chain fatty acid--CoA ligase [Moraxella catarrhalis]
MSNMTDFTVSTDTPWYKTYQEHGLDFNFDLPDNINSLMDIFDQAFARFGNQVAFTCMDKSITYRQLDNYSRQMAAYLQSLGLVKGDKVAVMMPNILQYPIAMIAIVRAGLTLVNVNPLYTSNELEHQLNDSEAKALFIVENFAHTFEKVVNKGQVRHVIVASLGDMLGLKGFLVNAVVRHVKKMVPEWNIPGHVSFKDALNKVPIGNYNRPNLALDDIAVLQYTGGTTGVAKGAMLTHRNLASNVEQCAPFLSLVFSKDNLSGQYIAVALPLYHIFSFTACGLLGMKMGFSMLLITNPRDFPALCKDYAKYKPAFFPAVNTLFNGLVHHEGFRSLDHSNLKLSLGGGMSVLSDTAKAWERLTGNYIIEGYGLSETSPVLTLNPPGGYTGKIGIPIPATDIKILDDEGNELAMGEAGEICAKGPQIMVGYWNRLDETEKVMTKDGFFRTGDIGVMDDRGFIKIVDRKKDMILVSGFNVYPNEVEDVITAHPKVIECGVIGVPDDHSGEVVKVFVVKKDPSLTADEVRAWAKENLTGYKRPKYIEFISELPKSNVGKILRKELRVLEQSK